MLNLVGKCLYWLENICGSGMAASSGTHCACVGTPLPRGPGASLGIGWEICLYWLDNVCGSGIGWEVCLYWLGNMCELVELYA